MSEETAPLRYRFGLVRTKANSFAGKRPILAWGVGLAAISLLLILFIDRPLALFIHNQSPEWLKDFFREVTWFGKADKYIWFFALSYLAMRAAFLASVPRAIARFYHQASRVALYVLVSLAAAGITVNLMKLAFGRMRPKYLIREDDYGFTFALEGIGHNSFPSGHSQTIFVVMTALALLLPRFRIPLFAFAGLVALSRVMVEAHFLSDILIGSYIGFVAALLVRRCWFADLAWPQAPQFERRGETQGKPS